jgi:hypothetical protein
MAEQTRLDHRPGGLTGLAVEEHGLDGPDLVAVGSDHLLAAPGLDVFKRRHGLSC